MSSGIKSYTIDRFLYDQERTVAGTAKHHGKMLIRAAFGLSTWKPATLDINRRTTIIIDECSMADNDKLSRALQHAEKAGCRVVLVGDHRQLQAIGQGGLFHELYLRARPEQKAALTEIVRQRESWAREAVKQIGRGEPAEALRAYERAGRLTVLPTRDDAERRLVERWREGGVTNPRDNLILASLNKEVSSLNRQAQADAPCRGATRATLPPGRGGADSRRRSRAIHRDEEIAWPREVRVCHRDPAGPAHAEGDGAD